MKMSQLPLRAIWVLSVVLAVSLSAQETKPSQELSQKPPAKLPLNELRTFVEAFDRISNTYVEEIDDKTLLENAIKGMLSRLDPHSAFLDKESFSDLQENTTGKYGGLGLEVDMNEGIITVIAPMDDTPAQKLGIEAGHLIIEIDDVPVKGMSLIDAIGIMRGEPGSEVKLTILKNRTSPPEEITIVREVIQVSSVRNRWLEEGYGYIRIAGFQSDTGPELIRSINKLRKSGHLNGLVLDLRNNPGGVLESAVDVTDAFISDGLIVYTSGRIPNNERRYHATTPDSTQGVPLVVLVNGGSASASEIVAGALQDHHRAIIMGTKTFGKGSVQTILPLNEEKAIKLTTALYYTPSGRSIQAKGITPDVWVARSKVTKIEENPFRIKEKDLPNHLGNGNGAPDSNKSDIGQSELASQDYQLNEALNVLKGLKTLSVKPQI